MSSDQCTITKERKRKNASPDKGMIGAIYGMALIGAAVYFIQHANSFWGGVLGFLKAIIWPVLVMYKVLELLQM